MAFVALAEPSARADSWPAAQIKEVFSASREWFVRVTPGTSVGETVGFAGSPKGKHATAEFYRRAADRSYRLTKEVTLRNPVAPVLLLVTDRGFLVTLDNWHNMGYGKAIASYSPEGGVVFVGELKDVFTADEVSGFRRSVSSIWWRTETVYVREGQQSIYIALDGKGSEVILEPETGGWQHCRWRGTAHQCRDSTDAGHLGSIPRAPAATRRATRAWRRNLQPPTPNLESPCRSRGDRALGREHSCRESDREHGGCCICQQHALSHAMDAPPPGERRNDDEQGG